MASAGCCPSVASQLAAPSRWPGQRCLASRRLCWVSLQGFIESQALIPIWHLILVFPLMSLFLDSYSSRKFSL